MQGYKFTLASLHRGCMESRKARVKRKLEDRLAGKEPQVTAADLLSQEIGEVPLPEERAVLRLSFV